MPYELRRSVELPTSATEAYRWHERPGAFERLSPPWEPMEVIEPPRLKEGTRARFRMRLGPVHADWVALHTRVEPGRSFVDVQEKGPFRRWEHEHRFFDEDGRGHLEDHVVYDVPLGGLGYAVAGGSISRRLERMFAYRHAVTCEDLDAHKRLGPAAPLHIAVTGATGLVGSALQPYLTTGGHEVQPISRSAGPEGRIVWDPRRGEIDAAQLEGVDAIVHLAGESVFGDRWSDAKRARIKESRVLGTSLIAHTVAGLQRRPKVLVCASATGFYGDTKDALVDETAPAGEGFLAEVCEAWERAADPARDAGIRVVHLRFGVVLSPKGGALQKQLPLFRAGLGGALGSGQQWSSFLGLDDALDIVLRALTDPRLEGPVNAVAPEPVRQRDFAKILGRVLGRPALLPAPSFALKLALGDHQAEEMLLFSSRVRPGRLLELGHAFRTPNLESILRRCLGREERS